MDDRALARTIKHIRAALEKGGHQFKASEIADFAELDDLSEQVATRSPLPSLPAWGRGERPKDVEEAQASIDVEEVGQ